MTIRIEVRNEYLVAQGLDREEGQYLGTQGWWYYGERSRAHGATLRALGVALHSRYLPANQCTVAAALLDVEHVVWTDSARAVVAAAAKNLKASRDAGENNTLVIPSPEGLTYRPYQIAGVQFALDAWKSKRRGVLIGDEMGLGKFHAVDTRVLTPTGWREIGDVRVGECVVGSNGRATRVRGVFPQGVKPSYRVRFSDHSSVEAGPEHLWTVAYRCGGRRWEQLTLTTEQLRTRPKIGTLDLSKTVLYLPMLSASVEFGRREELPVGPYTLGALIANGGLTNGTASLSVNALDWHELRESLCCEHEIGVENSYGNVVRARVLDVIGRVRELGLCVLSREKRIPRLYQTATPAERIALLQGLMDGDGSCSKTRSKLTYHTISECLADDVQELVEGLGGIASVRAYDRTLEDKPVEYQVRMRLPEWAAPFRISRKGSRYQPGSHARPVRTVVAVEYVREVESVCISVEADDHLYATEHCILTHNTMQGIGAMRVLDAQHTLVLCLTSLKRNWLREVGKWWPEAPASIVDSAGALLASHADRVTILSYSSLVGSSKRAKELREALSAQSFDLAVLDEAHVLKNEETQTSKFVLGAFKRGEKQASGLIERAERVLLMTGTPIQNRVRESLPLIRAIDGIGESGIIEKDVSFLFRYCGPEKIYVPGRGDMRTFNGATHLDELQSRLRGGGFMVRRLKAQVATELPPKVRTIVRLDCAEFEDLDRATKEISFDDSHLSGVTSDFTAMAAYRARLAARKAPQVIEHVQQLVDEGHKLLVFGHHETMIDALEQAFSACSLRIDGKTPEQDRQGLVDQFQIDASKRVGIISTRAGGTGLTLTAADVVVFAEADWNPAVCVQAEDRAHRIGQSADVVTVQYLVLDGTLDAHVLGTMIRKLDVADRALDRTKEVVAAPVPKPPKVVEPVRKVEIKVKGATIVHEITADRKAAIAEAFALLQGSCDGARSHDDVGFNGRDAHSEFVQSLCTAALAGQITDKQAAWCLQVLGTYKNTQLAALATRLFSE